MDYVPRERTPQGRVFEHASDCRVLLQHLKSIKKTVDVPEVTSNLFIKITKDTDDQDASTQASDTNDSEDE